MRAKSVSQGKKENDGRKVSLKTSWKDLDRAYAFGDLSREYSKKNKGTEELHVALRVQVIRCRNIGREKISAGSPVAPNVKRLRSNSTDSGHSNAPNAYVQVSFGGEKESTSRSRGFNPEYDTNFDPKLSMTFDLDVNRELERENAGRNRSESFSDECIVVQVIDGGGMTFSRTHILGECRIPLSLVRMSGMQHGSRKVGMDFRVFSSWFELQPAANTESPTTTRKSIAGPPGLSRTMTNTTPGVNGEIHLVLTVVCAPSHKDAHTKHLPDPWSLEKNRLNIELESKTPVFDEYVV